ncbi:MAG TPA: nucleotidyltransferase family protein [Bryobacteraceae bacterium]|nr:nucleotidyltransferase family protein [Bryobacteraceae bacterium]
MNSRCRIAGLILAGGASRRMGTPKALLRLQNETFLDRLIRIFSTVASPVIVVLGYQSDQIRSGIERASEVTFAVNPDPERGMLTSLQCGISMLPAETEAVMFTPVDHPHLQSETLQKLADRFESERAPVIVPTYGGEHGHPVCIARALAGELLALPPTAMASDVIHKYVPQTVYVEVDDPAVTTDVDDPEAYAGLLAQRP